MSGGRCSGCSGGASSSTFFCSRAKQRLHRGVVGARADAVMNPVKPVWFMASTNLCERNCLPNAQSCRPGLAQGHGGTQRRGGEKLPDPWSSLRWPGRCHSSAPGNISGLASTSLAVFGVMMAGVQPKTIAVRAATVAIGKVAELAGNTPARAASIVDRYCVSVTMEVKAT
jgi:hypothetical protein